MAGKGPLSLKRLKKGEFDVFLFIYNYLTKDISRAAFRFVMNHPDVHTVCCQMPNFEEMKHWISLSGSPISSDEQRKLQAYAVGLGRLYCRHACRVCEADLSLS
jgi:uncharacterized protein (UPF0548 family)